MQQCRSDHSALHRAFLKGTVGDSHHAHQIRLTQRLSQLLADAESVREMLQESFSWTLPKPKASKAPKRKAEVATEVAPPVQHYELDPPLPMDDVHVVQCAPAAPAGYESEEAVSFEEHISPGEEDEDDDDDQDEDYQDPDNDEPLNDEEGLKTLAISLQLRLRGNKDLPKYIQVLVTYLRYTQKHQTERIPAKLIANPTIYTRPRWNHLHRYLFDVVSTNFLVMRPVVRTAIAPFMEELLKRTLVQ